MIAEDVPLPPVGDTGALRRTALVVAALNFAYFAVEIVASNRIGSVSLYADSADFLEDAAVNTLIVIALGWSLAARARLGFAMAGIALLPGLAALWTAYGKLTGHGGAPDAVILGWVAAGAFVANVACAFLLMRHRESGGSLGKAAWLCARNDALANVAILLAALATVRWPTIWPDLIVGAGVFLLNLDAASDVLKAARDDRQSLRA
ncbi:cation transporter [Novosphingobium tardum]|uniref:Cation transporter n=1 Tax=Novosphingobium tardum TaxID=1538021 RepID=A0ABV8RNQ9_9SPHN